MNLTPSHWPIRHGEGPINAKPVVVWCPRLFTSENEQSWGNAGFDLRIARYETPRVFHNPLAQFTRDEMDVICENIWRDITAAARCKHPDVVVWLSIKRLFRPMVDAIYRKTNNRAIIVRPNPNGYTRIVLHQSRMLYLPWEPDVEMVLNRRRVLMTKQAG